MRATVEVDGFVLQTGLLPHLSTDEIARRFGRILDVHKFLPSSGIPTVQSLVPRDITGRKEESVQRKLWFRSFPTPH
jgi:hypothetical protein